ncbi:MAG: helicase-associated domain-containing protein [Anaerolineales bacterium]|nr:helicase-associated domain-containing protein [Anaerolineales bacterium]
MPDLTHSLLKQDLGHLRIIADFWGLELDSTDADSARDELTASLLDVNLLAELLDSLPPKADSALAALRASNGRIPWATFTRQFGDIREMGAGKRDREKPHLNPISTSEILFYRGLLARAFFDTDKGSQEFAYIPDDIFMLLNRKEKKEERGKMGEPLARPASPAEKGKEILADDSILDDATTMLAALRMSRSNWQFDQRLVALLSSANLIETNTIQTEAVKNFLEASRADALTMLHAAWMESDTFNELKLMPSLVCEGEWTNQPQETREFLFNLLDAIPEGKWWSLNAFVRDIKTKYADFQRPAGDYDSWFIKRAADGHYLRGFDSWNEVDGALIRFFITILHWLGQVDLSFAEGAEEATAFRIKSFESKKVESGKVAASSNGKISIERTAPRVVRYQFARFCEWEDVGRVAERIETKGDKYKYQITAQSLKHAKEQGLKAEQLLSLLVKHTDGKVPPPLVKALKRWEAKGTEARVETQTVLRVSQPELLEEMRKSWAGKFLGEVLSPTAVIVKSGAIQKVMEAMIELGLFAEIETLVE